jgi:hypothetical protein
VFDPNPILALEDKDRLRRDRLEALTGRAKGDNLCLGFTPQREGKEEDEDQGG